MFTAPSNNARASMNEDASLYERIGGEPTVRKLVDTLYDRVMADEVLAPFFEHSSVEGIRRMQREFLAAALGGPIVYAGRTLREAHSGRGITREHFSRFIDHLMAALKAHDLSDQDAYDVISRLNTSVDAVVGDTTNG